MTLKEKFALILMEFWSSDWESKCEQEADEFAIGFAEWLFTKDTYIIQREYNTKELLEIYKKEKGL
jgi:hypothetical protein